MSAPDPLPALPSGASPLRNRCRWGDFGCPDPAEVAEEARWLAEPAVAVVSAAPWRGGAGSGVLVTGLGPDDSQAALIQEWLGSIEHSRAVAIPASLRIHFGSHRALAVPMRTPAWTVGTIALPLRAGWGPMARELENLGSDFALRYEAADRRAQLAFLRIASVGRRPAGRRDGDVAVAGAPERVLGSGPTPRWRSGGDAGTTRREEPSSIVLGREGALALGRR